jgi:predicted membrane metal-binding protein
MLRTLKTVVDELVGLFVDDGSLALAILLWILIAAFLPRLGLPQGLSGPILFLGLLAILIENIARRANR